ncbi:hypothetical protein QE369_000672 [Agrobacterium larrymoorei]|uniref:Lipoprotein n=1 Tax=Agrobacterium larrymoorei TaxID=160699 RepID=A0AAJ2EQD2_9HYPH|nr:hypothetical protein [Agrobacterium larrymoorei]MDR6100494.1 hypothetical protein [Agrobacterium larrymoorei]
MWRTLFIVLLSVLLLTASGCAGHKELKAPCGADETAFVPSSSAYAASTPCGPLIRQSGVSVF